jgi:hypothetical protein
VKERREIGNEEGIMGWEQPTPHTAEFLARTLASEAFGALRAHTSVCAKYRNDLLAAEETWQQSVHISLLLLLTCPAMQVRLGALLAGYVEGFRIQPRHMTLALAAATLL